MNSSFGRKINSVNDFKFVAYWVSQEVGFETEICRREFIEDLLSGSLSEGDAKETAMGRGRN